MRSRFAVALTTTLGAAAAFASDARAINYCVEKPGCTGPIVGSLTDALTASAINPGRDSIELGPGQQNAPNNPAGFSIGAGNPVDIVGSPGTVLARPAGSGSVTLTVGEGSSTIRGLQVVLPASGNQQRAVTLTGNATLDGVSIAVPAGATAPVGVSGGLVKNSTIDVPSGTGVVAGTITDSTVSASTGIELVSGSAARRVRVTATTTGVLAQAGGASALDTAEIRMAGASAGLRGIAVDPPAGTPVTQVDARHVTVAGPGVGAGLWADGAAVAAAISDARLTVRDSVVTGFTATYLVSAQQSSIPPTCPTCPSIPTIGAASLTMGTSVADLDDPDNVDDPRTPFTDGGGNIDADPLLRSAADLRLQPGSPAIDKASAAAPAGDESTTDLAGVTRVAPRDIGAYEFLPDPPTLPPGPGTDGGGGGGAITPPAIAGVPTLGSSRLTMSSKGKIVVTLRCPKSGGACNSALTLTTKVRVRKNRKLRTVTRKLASAKAANIAPGASRKVTLTVASKSHSLVPKRGSRKASLAVTRPSGKPKTVAVTIKRATTKKKAKKR